MTGQRPVVDVELPRPEPATNDLRNYYAQLLPAIMGVARNFSQLFAIMTVYSRPTLAAAPRAPQCHRFVGLFAINPSFVMQNPSVLVQNRTFLT